MNIIRILILCAICVTNTYSYDGGFDFSNASSSTYFGDPNEIYGEGDDTQNYGFSNGDSYGSSNPYGDSSAYDSDESGIF